MENEKGVCQDLRAFVECVCGVHAFGVYGCVITYMLFVHVCKYV